MRKFRPLDIFCDCTVRFVSDLVENPKDRFSHNEAQNGLYLDFLFSAGSGLDRPNLGCFHYLKRVPGLTMYGLVSM